MTPTPQHPAPLPSTSPSTDLAERVRDALSSEAPVREVRMFGGLSFMVHGKMVVAVGGVADLLVRADPERHDELVARPGAAPAEMAAGRSMGRSWLSVAAASVADEADLLFWIRVGLDYNARVASGPR